MRKETINFLGQSLSLLPKMYNTLFLTPKYSTNRVTPGTLHTLRTSGMRPRPRRHHHTCLETHRGLNPLGKRLPNIYSPSPTKYGPQTLRELLSRSNRSLCSFNRYKPLTRTGKTRKTTNHYWSLALPPRSSRSTTQGLLS